MKAPRKQHHASLDDRAQIEQRRRAAAKDRKRVATKAEVQMPHRSEMDQHFDSSYFLPVAQTRCHQAESMPINSDKYATSFELHTIRTLLPLATRPNLSHTHTQAFR